MNPTYESRLELDDSNGNKLERALYVIKWCHELILITVIYTFQPNFSQSGSTFYFQDAALKF